MGLLYRTSGIANFDLGFFLCIGRIFYLALDRWHLPSCLRSKAEEHMIEFTNRDTSPLKPMFQFDELQSRKPHDVGQELLIDDCLSFVFTQSNNRITDLNQPCTSTD